MAQGSDGAGCFRRELKNSRRAGGESGGRELRRDHENGALTLRAVEMVVNRFHSYDQMPAAPAGKDRQSNSMARQSAIRLTGGLEVTGNTDNRRHHPGF